MCNIKDNQCLTPNSAKMKIQFNLHYFIPSVLLIITEIAIAIFLKHGFIRYTVGDFLVVILMYCLFRSFIQTKPLYIAIMTLLIACTVEFLQLVDVLGHFGLRGNRWVGIVMGTHFSIEDLIAYSLGVAVIFFIDLYLSRR